MATDLETAAAAPANEDDSVSNVRSGDSAILHGISWRLYRRLRKMPANYNIRSFPITQAVEIVRQVGAAHETELILAFRNWVRDNVPHGD